RVAGEVDAEHLVRLAFVPGGTRVDVHGGRQRRGLVRDGGAQKQTADRRQRGDVGRDAEAGAGFVDGAQPVEVGAAEAVACRLQGGDPGGGRYVDGEDVVRLLGRGVRAEQLLGVGGEPADGGHRSPPAPGAPGASGASAGPDAPGPGGRTRPLCRAAVEGREAAYRSPSDSRAIFSWSLRMPWSSASGRGGHPGT